MCRIPRHKDIFCEFRFQNMNMNTKSDLLEKWNIISKLWHMCYIIVVTQTSFQSHLNIEISALN